MLELAKIMARNRALARQNKPQNSAHAPAPTQPVAPRPRRLIENVEEISPEEEARNPQSVYVIPDAWESPKSLRSGPPQEAAAPDKRCGPKRKSTIKRRGQALSLCVSQEEEFELRQFAAKQGLSFSEWARTVLFKAMGRKVPKRI